MVKFHEDAYWLNNLSLFAFNIWGPWDQINKIMRENRRPVLLAISLEYLRIFCLLQGVQKWTKFDLFFFYILNSNKLHLGFSCVLDIEEKKVKFGPFFGHTVMSKIFIITPKIYLITLGACFPS